MTVCCSSVMYIEGRLGPDPHQGLLLLSLEACSWHSILITAASISGSGRRMGASASGCCVEAGRATTMAVSKLLVAL